MSNITDITQANAVITDLQGKLKIMERENARIQRESDQARKEMEAIKADAEATIANAAEQLAIGHAIAVGIYSLGQWAAGFIEQAVAAMHIAHREGTLVALLKKACHGIQKNDKSTLSQFTAEAEPIVNTHEANTELIRVEIEKACQTLFRERVREAMDALLATVTDPANLAQKGVYAAR